MTKYLVDIMIPVYLDCEIEADSEAEALYKVQKLIPGKFGAKALTLSPEELLDLAETEVYGCDNLAG